MKKYMLASLLVVGLLGSGIAFAAKTVSMEGIKCVVSGGAAKADSARDYREGQVYFCCNNCPKKFDQDKDKFATKANHQLVATHQYEQKACPFSGGDLNKETAIEVAGAKVAFCCNNCKGKAEKMKDDEKLAELFSNKAFEKAKFAKVETK